MSKRNSVTVKIGQRIKSIRLDLGLSMSEFAKRVDPSGKAKSGTVSNWEHGKNAPNAKRLRKIAELGNISVDELIGETEFIPTIRKFNQVVNDTTTELATKKISAALVEHMTISQKGSVIGLFTYIENLQAAGLPDNLKDFAIALQSMALNLPPVFNSPEAMKEEKAANKHSFSKFVDSYYKNAQFVQPQK